ncbi:MAG: hypothetical protein AAFV95_29415, partial [Bacteroidota bacterium]
MRRIIVCIFCFVVSVMSLRGQVQREYYDADWEPCQEEEALYYRQITYGADGRPEGVVRDHYIGGALQFEGRLLSVSP